MSGPRIPPLPREAWTEAAREVFAYWEGSSARENGSRSNTMMTLAQHPPLALATLDLGKYFMTASTLTPRHLKMVVLRVAHRNGSIYQWTHNALGARQLGMADAEIEALKLGPASAVWNAQDKAFLEAIDLVCAGGRFSDGQWQSLIAHFDRGFIMDLVHAAGYFSMVAWGLIAMGVEIEPDFAEFSRDRTKS